MTHIDGIKRTRRKQQTVESRIKRFNAANRLVELENSLKATDALQKTIADGVQRNRNSISSAQELINTLFNKNADREYEIEELKGRSWTLMLLVIASFALSVFLFILIFAVVAGGF